MVMACNAGAEDEAWLTIFWDIENYNYYGRKRDQSISSPLFRVESIEKSTWVFGLFPQGRKEEAFIAFKLYGSLSDTSKVIEVEFEVAILMEDGSVLKMIEREGTCYRTGSPMCLDAFALREEVTKTKRDIFLSRDTFRTRCRLWRTVGKVDAPFTIFGRTALKEERRNVIGFFENFSHLGNGTNLSIDKSVSTKPSFTLKLNYDNYIKIYTSFVDMDVTYFTIQIFIKHTDGSETDSGIHEIWPDGKTEAVFPLPLTKGKVMNNKYLYLEENRLWVFFKISLHTLKQYISYRPLVDLASDIDEKNQEIKLHPRPHLSTKTKEINIGITSTCNHNIPNSYKSSAEANQMKSMPGLKEDFDRLYSEGIVSDVKLRTASETFHAHKAILSARSPVFLAMFTTDMKEKVQDCVDVPDLEDDTVHRMLLFLYTDNLKDLQWQSALKLFSAADKYQIVALKVKCCSFLKQNLCPSNVCDMLVLADLHGDHELKKAAQEYALAHEEDVFSSEEWTEFAKSNSGLAAETMLWKWKRTTIAS